MKTEDTSFHVRLTCVFNKLMMMMMIYWRQADGLPQTEKSGKKGRKMKIGGKM